MKLWTKFKINILPIFKLFLTICGVLFTACSIALSFATWEELGLQHIGARIGVALGIIFVSFLVATLLVLFIFKTSHLWKKGKNEVIAMYGDLLKISFVKNKKDTRIVVIPVNDTFDTIVEEPSELIKHPLVSSETLHGMWINKFCKEEKISPEELNDRIQKNLKLLECEHTTVKRESGNLERYPLGSTAVINGSNGVVFYLFAISSFDEKNNAHVSKRELRESLEKLLQFYYNNGQSKPLFIPLMGTGSSRAGLSHEQSFKTIKSSILTFDEYITGSVNIVVYKKDRNKVSIFK